MNHSEPSRRDLLRALRGGPSSGSSSGPLNGPTDSVRIQQPVAGSTIRLGLKSMACEFAAILNPGPAEQISVVGEALEIVPQVESWLSIYRAQSEISLVNRMAFGEAVSINAEFVELIELSLDLHCRTSGAFDLAAGFLNRLWKDARKRQEIPSAVDIESALSSTGSQHVMLDQKRSQVRFAVPDLQLDPGAIGKGFALDKVRSWLQRGDGGTQQIESALLHGGHSSLIAWGNHNQLEGWPVGIGNPLFTNRRLGTLLLRNQAMATSGSNIQFYRYEGKRYGHILDPRTGWPVEGMLSVTVLAPSAAVADAVSTAFFVLGIEKAVICCENLPEVGVILIPFPEQGRKVRPHLIGIPADQIFWDLEQVEPVSVTES